MKVLLLGASGLLGHNVLACLLANGHQVVALVRRRKAVVLDDPACTFIERPALDTEALTAAAEGCDAIINCAGVTDMSLPRLEDYLDINQHLCRRIVEAMETHGINTLVHVSTVNTIGYGTTDNPSKESAPIMEPFSKSHYAVSKLHGESEIMQAANKHPDWHIVIVNPGFMIGSMDVKPSSGKLLLAGYRHPIMFAPTGGKAFVDVRDVATATVNALTMGRSGERYIAVNSHAHHTIKELYIIQSEVMGYRQRVVEIPNWLLLAAGAIGNGIRALGIRTQLSTNNVRQLMVQEYYDNTRAVDELEMSETPIERSIADFYLWRKNNTNK